MRGQLIVSDSHGRVASAIELVETARASAAELAGAALEAPINAEDILPFLFANQHHLIEWGKANGYVFLFVETPGIVVDSDLRNFTETGYGEVINAGYYRNSVGGGESEPWRDDLYSTARCATTPAQNTETLAPVGTGGASDDKPPTNWRHAIQAEAYQHWLRLRACGCNPSVFSICGDMATWCIEKNIKGGKGQNPRAGTIRNTVLAAGHWTPPHHSVAEAKKHIAQIAQTAQTKVA